MDPGRSGPWESWALSVEEVYGGLSQRFVLGTHLLLPCAWRDARGKGRPPRPPGRPPVDRFVTEKSVPLLPRCPFTPSRTVGFSGSPTS